MNNEDDGIEISLSLADEIQISNDGSSWASFGEQHIGDVTDPGALHLTSFPASDGGSLSESDMNLHEPAAVDAPSRPISTMSMSKKSKVIVGIAAGAVFLVALSVGIIMGRTKETEQSTMVVSLLTCLDQPEYEEYKVSNSSMILYLHSISILIITNLLNLMYYNMITIHFWFPTIGLRNQRYPNIFSNICSNL